MKLLRETSFRNLTEFNLTLKGVLYHDQNEKYEKLMLTFKMSIEGVLVS